MTRITRAEFLGQPLDIIIDRNGQRWLTAEQIGLAMGYAPDNARKGINKLYNAHADEFTEADTFVVKMATNPQGGNPTTRIFSATGCNLLSFFANTARAKQFRAWAKQALTGQPAPVPAAPSRGGRTPLITRVTERMVFEHFVAGWGQADIARALGLSRASVNLLLHAKYQFSPAAGSPQCSPELLAAVASRHLAIEQARLAETQQRLAQRFCNSANNQTLADQLDRVGRHLQQAPAQALLPLDVQGGEQ